ncbi:MAG: MBL fold metallo-hydrolase [Gallionellaceae bacterium]|nr:MAG: MBL fold metallo-hydrolase [Gallionellaceae bacterium]
MRFALLGSGSEGNALVVEVDQTRVLMDCGFSLGETVARLARIGLVPEQLHGIVVTHEHGDHIGGVARLARKYSLPVFLTHGTLRSQNGAFANLSCVTGINPHLPFAIGDVLVQPYPVPHDACEPVQYVFSDGAKRLGVLTDAGCSTPHIEATLSGCDALVLECNHDAELLANGDYPYSLKQRVGGRFGHLNNLAAAALLARLDNSRLQHIVAAHLSHKNNTRALAVSALSGALSWAEERIVVATQNEGSFWCEIA